MSKLALCWPPVGWVSYFLRDLPLVGVVGEGNFGYPLALRRQRRRPVQGRLAWADIVGTT